jgi:Formate hydrogenlyase subunit 6/NADH:ubiquinone oxidoreductase 23 kD subunit (chain I)
MDFPFVKEAISQLFSKPSCAMYPFVPSEAAPRYRGKLSYDPDKCMGCGMCERVCAGSAITRVIEPVEEGDRITLTFNMGSCTFCGTCSDFCSTKAITLTPDYHMAVTTEKDLLITGSHIKVKKKAAPAPEACGAAAGVQPRDDGKPVQDPNLCVYCTLCAKKCPQEAITVDRAEKTWKLDDEKCIGCGTCAGACPKKAIIM